MTSDRPDRKDDKRDAVARAARGLSAGNPLAHVFFEERTDSRVTFASSGLREAVTTRTSGGTIAGARSVHMTEPDFLEPPGERMADDPAEMADLDHRNWVAKLEAAVTTAGTASAAGRGHAAWTARLVAFRQKVWVGRPGRDVSHDIRAGSRLELRTRIGATPAANAIQELVLRSGASPPIREAFERAFDRAEHRGATARDIQRGVTAAILAPGVGGIVAHELIGHALEGDVVARGATWVSAGGLPTPKLPVSVIDDPRRGRGSWRIDDEGIESRETVLVDQGRAAGLLLDQSSASSLGKAPTGHGRRSSYLETVRARMGCTFIESGTDDPEEVLRSTQVGVFIRRLIGGHTDPVSGRATFIVSDSDRIVDGRVAEPLDPFVIELAGSEAWGSIDRVAHDLAFDTCIGSCIRDGQPIAVSVGAPTIRIGVVRVRS